MGNVKPVQEFKQRVEWLYEPEYGDFKRKVNLYLIRMEEQLGPDSQKVKDLLSQVMEFVVYSPSGSIEPTREKTLQMADEMVKRLQ